MNILARLRRWLSGDPERKRRELGRNAQLLSLVLRETERAIPGMEARILSTSMPAQQDLGIAIETLHRWRIWAKGGCVEWLHSEGAFGWAAEQIRGVGKPNEVG